MSNNCEHFTSFCATGNEKYGQMKNAVVAGAIGVGVAAAVGLTVIGGIALKTKMKNSSIEKGKY